MEVRIRDKLIHIFANVITHSRLREGAQYEYVADEFLTYFTTKRSEDRHCWTARVTIKRGALDILIRDHVRSVQHKYLHPVRSGHDDTNVEKRNYTIRHGNEEFLRTCVETFLQPCLLESNYFLVILRDATVQYAAELNLTGNVMRFLRSKAADEFVYDRMPFEIMRELSKQTQFEFF